MILAQLHVLLGRICVLVIVMHQLCRTYHSYEGGL